MIHGMDFDDYHNAKIHPGAPVIPAALAVGELLDASGRDVLTAIAAGYETMIRVSLATGPNASRLKGWHLTGTTGTFGAAAAAGRLLGLSDSDMAGALGMAGTQSSGLWAFLSDGAMSKRFHAGRAGQSGVMAAFLVQNGFRGPTRILEAEDGGFCRAMSDQVDLSLATAGLGKEYHCADVNIKPYACCASSHSAVDAVLELRREGGFAAEDVASVVVKTARGVQVQCGFPYTAAGVVQAQMSLQYIVAVSLTDGAALLDQFTEDRITDSGLLDLARRVTIVVDPEIDVLYPRAFANRVEVILKNGRRLETRIDHPKGSTAHPMAFADVADKFRGLASRTVSPDTVEQIIDRIRILENEPRIRNLSALLSGNSAADDGRYSTTHIRE
jgi:2-methylcitrate dehydratase PrpD